MKKYIVTIALVAGLGCTAAALAEEADNQGAEKKARLEKFDKDGDGKLNDEERAAAKAARGDGKYDGKHDGKKHGKDRMNHEFKKRIMEQFDKDGDGKLNEEEREAAKAAHKDRMAKALAEFDKDKDGKLNEEERAAAKAAREAQMKERKAKVLAEFDKDKDGELNEEERAAAKAARKAEKEQAAKPE